MNETTLIITCIGSALVSGLLSGSITASIIARKKSYKSISKLLKKSGEISNYSEIGQIIASQIDQNNIEHKEINKNIDILNWERRKNIKKVGHIRYNAILDVGGNLSFSLVMLNEENTGIILTNIHMREESSIYLREIKLGECKINLSEEEKEILKKTTRQ